MKNQRLRFRFQLIDSENFHEAKKAIKVGSRSFRENLSPLLAFLMHQFSKEEETKQKKKSCFEMNEKMFLWLIDF